MVAVAPMPTPEVWSPSKEAKQNSHDKEKNFVKVKGVEAKKTTATSIIRVKEMPGSCGSTPMESQYGSSESITSSTKSAGSSCNNESRNGSARSNDSGLGREQQQQQQHTDIITEKSNPGLAGVANMPEKVPDPNLVVHGKQIKTPGPMGHRRRSNARLPPVHPRGRPQHLVADEQSLESILRKRVQFADVLIDELPVTSSIMKRPVSRGGVAFEIKNGEVDASTRTCVRKPACVLKYAQHRRATEVVTHAELDEKQKVADLRRKVSL